jgi:hypothetical protein
VQADGSTYLKFKMLRAVLAGLGLFPSVEPENIIMIHECLSTGYFTGRLNIGVLNIAEGNLTNS